MRIGVCCMMFCAVSASVATGDDLLFKDRYLKLLVEHVPATLKHYDAKTRRFGEGIWICTDQNVMLPLAIVYSTRGPGNTYYKDEKLLDVIMKAGDALIDDMDENGQWVFRKKDGSTWGKISMPWTYSRWIRTFALIRDDMPPDRRERWVKALMLGYGYIFKTQLGHLHNIPTHHAMGLYAAGKALNQPEWCRRADEYLHKVIATQAEGGYWSEGEGPVVNYNFVYIDAIGTYFVMSGDKTVLPAIEKAIGFHSHFTYPSGEPVETIDQRNPFHAGILPGNPAFSLTAEGRSWLNNQWRCDEYGPLSDDAMALFILHGQEGPVAHATSRGIEDLFVLRDNGVDRAMTLRRGPWFVCLSAYVTPIGASRWHQDRQNLVSIWHEKLGLILGGGNTKLQPRWSNFTVGDVSLLKHTPGDENPNFQPKGELYHVPSAAQLVREPVPGLDLTYGPDTCRIRVRIRDENTLEFVIEAKPLSDKPVVGHVTLLPQLGTELETKGGHKAKLTESPIDLTEEQVGGGLTYAGCYWTLPPTASLHWPVLPHNPYVKDGRASPGEGRIEIRLPFDAKHREHVINIQVLD